MKRNRKAEAEKRRRQLTRQETERKRLAILLTEMEEATANVLRDHFAFTGEQLDHFLDLLRQRYRAIHAQIPLFSQDKRLGVAAQKFGLAGMQILIESYGFGPEEADRWLKGLIEEGQKGRETHPAI